MTRTFAKSAEAARAQEKIDALQQRFASGLEGVAQAQGSEDPFEPIEWLRDEGRHGGGVRLANGGSPLFNRASINVSAVHYDDDPKRRLSSANALSTIIHPRHPRAPSMHMHISWTEMREGGGSWRVMADLNPSIPNGDDTARFAAALKEAAGDLYEEASAQGDKYFYIPALGRHRGVTHFYLEGHQTGDLAGDRAFAQRMGEATIDTYCAILNAALADASPPTDAERQTQLAYHTTYLFQVLTLDRGTTSGLLIHDQNDIGIMGSLPNEVDRALLLSWKDKVSAPQDELVQALVDALPAPDSEGRSAVTTEVRQALADAVRRHYRAHPEALQLQASGDTVPPTVDNHGAE